jgi:hypothetical protein
MDFVVGGLSEFFVEHRKTSINLAFFSELGSMVGLLGFIVDRFTVHNNFIMWVLVVRPLEKLFPHWLHNNDVPSNFEFREEWVCMLHYHTVFICGDGVWDLGRSYQECMGVGGKVIYMLGGTDNRQDEEYKHFDLSLWAIINYRPFR